MAEISSFQLETIQDFCPQVSAILNITEDHLNRHHTMEEYIRVKELITENQGEDQVCVLNYEDLTLREFGKNLRAKTVYFSSLQKLPQGVWLGRKEYCAEGWGPGGDHHLHGRLKILDAIIMKIPWLPLPWLITRACRWIPSAAA